MLQGIVEKIIGAITEHLFFPSASISKETRGFSL